MPNWLDSYSGSDLAEKVEKRIDDALSHFNGSLTGWDVNNEMTHGEVLLTNTNDPDIRCAPATTELSRHGWYTGSRCTSGLTRKTPAFSSWSTTTLSYPTPENRLQYQPVSSLVQGNKAAEYVALIRDLLDRGAPIHGIGVQGHMSKGGPVRYILY